MHSEKFRCWLYIAGPAGSLILSFRPKNSIPMTKDSAASSLKADVKSMDMDSPRLSSLMFVRQFARVYMNFDIAQCSGPIMN